MKKILVRCICLCNISCRLALKVCGVWSLDCYHFPYSLVKLSSWVLKTMLSAEDYKKSGTFLIYCQDQLCNWPSGVTGAWEDPQAPITFFVPLSPSMWGWVKALLDKLVSTEIWIDPPFGRLDNVLNSLSGVSLLSKFTICQPLLCFSMYPCHILNLNRSRTWNDSDWIPLLEMTFYKSGCLVRKGTV